MARTQLPRVFARYGEPQPLTDLILFDRYDPTIMGRDLDETNALRAIGLTEYSVRHCTSSELPGLLLEPPPEETLIPGLLGQPTWALWGQERTVADHLGQLVAAYGGGGRGIADIVHDRARGFLVLVAISQLLTIANKKLAILRDDARSRHRQFRVRDLNQLRDTFLTLSVDMTSIRRDLDASYSRTWPEEGEAQFTVDYSPWIIKWYEQERRNRDVPVNVNDQLKDQQLKGFNLIVAADRDYREILSTVASLGASVSASRLGRAAVAIAIATFAVAVATLLTAKIDHNAPLFALGRWLWLLFGK